MAGGGQTASTATAQKPAKPPAKYVNFGARDSRAIEAAFQKLCREDEAEENAKYMRASALDLFVSAPEGADLAAAAAGKKVRKGKGIDSRAEKAAKVPVNEDFLFDVDIKKRELMPVYWEGPVYDVRRGTWFYQGTDLGAQGGHRKAD